MIVWLRRVTVGLVGVVTVGGRRYRLKDDERGARNPTRRRGSRRRRSANGRSPSPNTCWPYGRCSRSRSAPCPTADAYWQDDLPAHPRCELGPREPGRQLAADRPAEPPAPPSIPTPLLRHLVWDLSADSTPTLATDAVDGAPEEVRAAYLRWHEEQWRPWSREHRAAAATRDLHDRLFDLRTGST